MLSAGAVLPSLELCLCNQPARGNTCKHAAGAAQQPTTPPHVAVTLLWPTLEHASKREKLRAFCSQQDDLAVVSAENAFFPKKSLFAKEKDKTRTPAEIFPAARGLEAVNLRTTSALVHLPTPPALVK